MQKPSLLNRIGPKCAPLFVLVLALVAAACSSAGSAGDPAVQQAVNNYLQPLAPRDVVVDLVHKNPNIPDKAYASVTVTHNFATREGTPQKEYLGFLLTREGEGWKVAENTKYTTEEKLADLYLAGRKK